MSAIALHDVHPAAGLVLQSLARPASLPPMHCYPAIRVVGAGVTGARLLDALYRTGVEGDVEFIHATVDGRESKPIPANNLDARFRDADLVFMLADAREAGAVQVLRHLAATARNMGVFVLAMLTQGTVPRAGIHNAVSAVTASADAVIVLSPSADTSAAASALAYAQAMVDGLSEGFRRDAPDAADFLDVRTVFAGQRGACIGIGRADGGDRARRAATQAITDAGLPRVAGASGVLMLIAGSRSLALPEIAAATEAVRSSTSGHANTAVGVHYDERLGSTVRVTVIAAGLDAPAAS